MGGNVDTRGGGPSDHVNRFVPRGCSDDSVICATKDDYPEDYVNNLVAANADKLTEFFSDDIVPEVVQRVDSADEPLCASKEVVIYPTVGQTQQNSWAFIINNANYSQGVRVEQCL